MSFVDVCSIYLMRCVRYLRAALHTHAAHMRACWPPTLHLSLSAWSLRRETLLVYNRSGPEEHSSTP